MYSKRLERIVQGKLNSLLPVGWSSMMATINCRKYRRECLTQEQVQEVVGDNNLFAVLNMPENEKYFVISYIYVYHYIHNNILQFGIGVDPDKNKHFIPYEE